MGGASGHQAISLPSNYKNTFNFVNISNITDNSMCVYPPHVTEPQAGASIVCLGPYSSMSYPILPQMREGFNIVWTNPGLTNLTVTKSAQVVFSEQSLGFNSSFAPSFTTGGNVQNVSMVKIDPTLLTGLLANATLQQTAIDKLMAVVTALTTGPVPIQLTGSSLSDTEKSDFLPTKTVIDRTTPVLLRTVTSNDVLDNPVIDTVTGQEIVDGSLLPATAYKYSICAINLHGSTIPITIATATPGGSNNALRLPISQVANAEGYVIFLSTDTQPKMVLQITEAQRAAGGICTAVYEYAEGGIPGAIDIGVVGAGAAANAAGFTTMTAYTPEIIPAGEILVNTYNKNNLAIVIDFEVDDYRISPLLSYIVAGRVVAGEGEWIILQSSVGTITNGRRKSIYGFGGSGGSLGECTVLIYALAGQNVSVPITAWYY